MPGKPLTAVVVVGALACGAAVALEAVGTLFPTPDTASEPRMESVLAQLGFNTESMVAPTRPVDLPDEAAAQEPVWHDPEPSAAPPQDAEAAEGSLPTPAPPGETRTAVALTMTIPQGPALEDASDEEESPVEQLSLPWQPPVQPVVQAPEPAVVVTAVQAAEPLLVQPQRQRSARTERTTSVRAGPSGYAGFGWPLLDWLIQ